MMVDFSVVCQPPAPVSGKYQVFPLPASLQHLRLDKPSDFRCQPAKRIPLTVIVQCRTAYGNRGFSKDKTSTCFPDQGIRIRGTALTFPECQNTMLCGRRSPGCTVLRPLPCAMPAKRRCPLSPSASSRTFRHYRSRNADAVLDRKKEAGSFQEKTLPQRKRSFLTFVFFKHKYHSGSNGCISFLPIPARSPGPTLYGMISAHTFPAAGRSCGKRSGTGRRLYAC